MSLKNSIVVAKVVFTDGNPRFFDGTRYEKTNIKMMVYHLRKMILGWWSDGKLSEVQIFDNTRTDDKMIFEFKHGVVLKNELASYLGADYNPKKLN